MGKCSFDSFKSQFYQLEVLETNMRNSRFMSSDYQIPHNSLLCYHHLHLYFTIPKYVPL